MLYMSNILYKKESPYLKITALGIKRHVLP